jgi:hypothetical protein
MCDGGAACECTEAEVRPTTSTLDEIWDDIGAPSSETELLKAAVKYPGIDPYATVSGMVRGVAVDRWCNNLIRSGLIIGWEEDDGRIWIWATEEGKAMFA